MSPHAKIARRRLKLDELVSKLEQIQQHASLTLAEDPSPLTGQRQRLIVGLTKQILAHLQDQIRAGAREDGPAEEQGVRIRVLGAREIV